MELPKMDCDQTCVFISAAQRALATVQFLNLDRDTRRALVGGPLTYFYYNCCRARRTEVWPNLHVEQTAGATIDAIVLVEE
jgi:hypothetical protein